MPVPADDLDAVDYRSGTPWDFGLLPDVLRRIAACTRAQVAAAKAPLRGRPLQAD
ncbi:MAG: hypothetical protein MUD11_08355 [Rhodobacteraceae bacterium]|nr:hypothetical protein [Paracoccaceae bacterium]